MSTHTPPLTKHCGDCKEHKPVTEFAFKSRAAGTRQSRCRACMAAYNKAYHQANKATLNPRIHATNRTQRAELVAAADRVRHTACCPRCGRDRASGADIILLPPEALSGGRRLSDLIRSGWGMDRFTSLLEATVADPAGVRCRTCLGRELGRGNHLAPR